MQPFWRRSILVLAATEVIGIAVIVGMAFVLLTVFLTESYTQKNAEQRINEMLGGAYSLAQAAALSHDEMLAADIVVGLTRNREVLGAALFGGDELLSDHYKPADEERQAKAKAGRIVRKIVSPIDAKVTVGVLWIDPDPEVVRERVRDNGAYVALLLGVQLLLVGGAVVAIVLLVIVRPIKRMSDKLHVMDADSIEPLPIPPGQEHNEIGRLVADINQLGQRLLSSRDEEHNLHVQCEIGERKYRAIFEHAEFGIFVVDRQTRIESCNQSFYRQLDIETQGDGRSIVLSELNWGDPDGIRALVERCARDNVSVSEDFEYCVDDEEEPRWLNVALIPVGDQLIQGQLNDITRHKQAERSAQREAMTDPLTGLFNRSGFLQKIEEEISAYAEGTVPGFALLIVDLDGFRRVNESLGLASGDQILEITANRLRSCLKSTDVISRLANDAFGVILRSACEEKLVASVATRISLALKGFFEVGNTPLQLGASIGITLFPNDGIDRETLMRNAEMAFDHSRKNGNGRYCFFDFTMARNAEHRRQLEDDLRFAVRRHELIIAFQPIVSLKQRCMIGAEALIRWRHPERGVISPDVFIPLAEETGAIVNIGLWTIEAACQQLARWKQQGANYYVSVNISPRQIPEGLPPITLIETANRYGVDPSNLVIEITENLFLGDTAVAQTWLDAVHELGFKVYLDDFGTGYSSLSYIKRFPVDALKIDKTFVRDMGEDNNDRALVEAIINMASSLGLTVVAEGVENVQQLTLLDKAGCGCVQGYYFSRPIPIEQIEEAERKIRELF